MTGKKLQVLFRHPNTGRFYFKYGNCIFIDFETFMYRSSKENRWKVVDRESFIRLCGGKNPQQAKQNYEKNKKKIEELKDTKEYWDKVRKVDCLAKTLGVQL